MGYNIQDDDTIIDLSRLFKTIIRKWRFVIVLAIIGTILTTFPVLYGLLKNKPKDDTKAPIEKAESSIPIYESATLMEIRLPEESSEQAQATVELVRSNTVFKKVIDSMKLEISIEDLRGLVSVSGSLRSTINTVEIKVIDEDPSLAKKLADSIREHAKIFINNSMQIESFRVIQQANLPNEPIFNGTVQKDNKEDNEGGGISVAPSIPIKSVLKQAILGTVLGIFISLFIIFIQFVLNDKIQTVDDVERYLGKRVLASIPIYKRQKLGKGR